MKKNFFIKSLGVCAALVLLVGLAADVFAQGKGKGGGKGNSGATRGKSNKSNKSKSADDPLWSGFPDDREREKRGNGNKSADGKSQRFKGLARKTGLSEEALRARFKDERSLNPDLTYGQFVAAHMISRNHRGISPDDILDGLRDGRSIGQTLKNKGWDKGKINKEKNRIRDLYRDDEEFDDRDDYLGF